MSLKYLNDIDGLEIKVDSSKKLFNTLDFPKYRHERMDVRFFLLEMQHI